MSDEAAVWNLHEAILFDGPASVRDLAFRARIDPVWCDYLLKNRPEFVRTEEGLFDLASDENDGAK